MGGTVLDPMTFKLLVEDGADAMFIVRFDRRGLAYVNQALVQMLGYDDPSELLGRGAKESIIHPADHALIDRVTDETRRGMECPPMAVRWVRKDGTAVQVVGCASIIEYEGGAANLVVARRDSQLQALRIAEERSRLLFDRCPLPISVWDAHTHQFLAANQAMVDLYGYSQAEFLAMKLPEIKFADEILELPAEVDTVMRERRLKVGVRRHRTKDGRILEVDITSHAIEFDGRQALLAIGVDVTEARRLEAQLRQAQKMEAVGQLAGGVAHDFNNLLCVILANVELALERDHPENPRDEELREIELAANRATQLTRQLLAFSRKQPNRIAPVALDDIVASCEKMLSRIVGEDIEISTLRSPVLATIRADAAQLEQVLVNLVVNARDAMPNGGLLIVETCNTELDAQRAAALGLLAGLYVELSVHDSGCGMDAETRARIFEPFFTTKDVGKGTGLGLATVFGIVQQSRGAIEVQSEPGRGTLVRLLFPAVAHTEATERACAPIVPVRGHETVLLVEDDPRLRNVIRRHLHQLGYTILEAASGHAGLELLRGNDVHIDVLLTDLVMPGLDGRTFALEAVRVRPALRVVFMSGFAEHVAVKTARFEDAVQFVEKPFSSAKLSHAIRRALL